VSDSRRVAVALHIDEPYPHHQEVLAGIGDYTREHPGWEWVIDEHPGYKHPGYKGSGDKGRGGGESLGPYAGVIARAGPAMQRRLRKAGIPLVNTWYQHAGPGLPGVYIDGERIGRMAAGHLLERGFQRLGFFAPANYRHTREIGQAFATQAEEDGRACLIDGFEMGSISQRQYWLGLRKRLSRFLDALTPPVGVFVTIDWMARILASLCHNRGWHLPGDLSLVCMYDVHGVVDLHPRITCIDCNYERVGYEAAALLERLMAGEPPPDKPIFLPPRGVIARESTDFLAVEDEVVAEALAYISKNLARPLSVDQVAKAIAVSPRSLQRRFTAALGRAVSDEVRRLRVVMAKRLLGEPGVPIKQIARDTGFSSPSLLHQVFQRELGMTPGAYRKQVLGEWKNS